MGRIPNPEAHQRLVRSLRRRAQLAAAIDPLSVGRCPRKEERSTGQGAGRGVDLRDAHATGFYGVSLSLTPDDQTLMTRDIGTQEIFTLGWQAP